MYRQEYGNLTESERKDLHMALAVYAIRERIYRSLPFVSPGRRSYLVWKNFRSLCNQKTEILSRRGRHLVLDADESETPDGVEILNLDQCCVDGQSVHPDVIHSRRDYPGKYLMAISNFPYKNDNLEDPVLLSSEDGKQWQRVCSLPTEGFPKGKLGYHSDPAIFFGEEGLYFADRRVTVCRDGSAGIDVTLFFHDREQWAKKAVLMTAQCPWDNHMCFLSPTFAFLENRYFCWYVQKNTEEMPEMYCTIFNEKWKKESESRCTVTGLPVGETLWHIDICRLHGRLLMAADIKKGDTHLIRILSGNSEGLQWKAGPVAAGPGIGFAERSVYRASLVVSENDVYLYYTGRSRHDCWQTAVKCLPTDRLLESL